MKARETVGGLRECSACREWKAPELFNLDSGMKDGFSSCCKVCARARSGAWYGRNKDRARVNGRVAMARKRVRLRQAVLEAYGRHCACCGETEEVFLALDHKHNDGRAHRESLGDRQTSSSRVYWDVARRGFPDHYQLLCHNCNMGKAIAGVCPHEAKREAAA